MIAMAGYSGTPLAQKLGLKDGQAVGFVDLPADLSALAKARDFGRVEAASHWSALGGTRFDVIHMFAALARDVEEALPVLRDRIMPDGMIWMSWPKKASKVPTDVTEDVIRKRALRDVLVDVKVCAVNDVWSGLKLVVRKELRDQHKNFVKG